MSRMLSVFVLILSVCCLTGNVEARNRGRVGNAVASLYRSLPVGHSNATAQGVANALAHLRWMGHFGGNPGYEGCGMGATKEAAYNVCCYANSGMKTVDVGYAQDVNGMWYCCRRYR